jgi:ubiquinone/menaquinone biosynthesis C-methylase UbiE
MRMPDDVVKVHDTSIYEERLLSHACMTGVDRRLKVGTAMDLSDDPRRGLLGPYFVPDPTNDVELIWLHILDRMLTARMGGVLSEQEDLSRVQRVVDVGCGTGGWLIRTAQTYSAIKLLVGVDMNDQLVQHARKQVALYGLDSERVCFATLDALVRIEAPFHFFDLINQRATTSWLRTRDWPKLLQEYQRIGSPDGIVRITEPEMAPSACSSQALTRLYDLLLTALHRAGHLFAPTRDGLTGHLPALLQQHGFRRVLTRTTLVDIDYNAEQDQAQQDREDLRYLFRTILPFLRQWIGVPDDYEALYQQAMNDLAESTFRATSSLVTIWAVMSADD